MEKDISFWSSKGNYPCFVTCLQKLYKKLHKHFHIFNVFKALSGAIYPPSGGYIPQNLQSWRLQLSF